MEFRQIQHFMQLYFDKNITKASHNLYISQQGLSKSINKLEGELGFPLFKRSPSGVEPTERAVSLYEYFEKITLAYRDLLIAIDGLHENKKLTIIAPTGFAFTQERSFLSSYRVTHPDVHLCYEEHPNSMIPSLLQSGRADIAYMHTPLPETVKSISLLNEEPYMAVIHHDHPLVSRKSVHLIDLTDQHLLLLDEINNFNEALLNAINASHTHCESISYSGITEFLPLIQTGDYIGFAPESFFQYMDFPDITYVPLKLEKVKPKLQYTHLVIGSSAILSPEATEYIGLYDIPVDTETDKSGKN